MAGYTLETLGGEEPLGDFGKASPVEGPWAVKAKKGGVPSRKHRADRDLAPDKTHIPAPNQHFSTRPRLLCYGSRIPPIKGQMIFPPLSSNGLKMFLLCGMHYKNNFCFLFTLLT